MSIFARLSRQDIPIEADYAMDKRKSMPESEVLGINFQGGVEIKLTYKSCSFGVGYLLLQCY